MQPNYIAIAESWDGPAILYVGDDMAEASRKAEQHVTDNFGPGVWAHVYRRCDGFAAALQVARVPAGFGS